MEAPAHRLRMESTDAAAWVQAVGRGGGRLGRGSYDGTRASCSPWTRWHTSQLAIRVSDGNARAPQFRRAESGRRCQTLPWRRLGYFRQQATRPQTIGYALSDSPAGQAMWIYEKFYSWTDNSGSPEDALCRDQMLDDILLYWFTNTAASAAPNYWENKGGSFSGGKLSLPVAATVFPREIYRAPKSWAEQTYSNLIYWNEAEHGGHFAAFEQPDIFVEEKRSAFRKLREQ